MNSPTYEFEYDWHFVKSNSDDATESLFHITYFDIVTFQFRNLMTEEP